MRWAKRGIALSLAVLTVAAALAVLAAPGVPARFHAGVAVRATEGGRPLAGPPPPVAAGGRLFTNFTTTPDGDTNSVTGIAIDPARAEVFAANRFAGTVTGFNESTGQLLSVTRVAELAQGSFPAGLALDPVGHRLFVPVSTVLAPTAAGGWLLVLDESTLGLLANVTFPSAPLGVFEPTFLAYDAPTDQLFVENASFGEVAAVNLTTFAVTSYLPCPVALCAMHGYGLLDIPAYHTLLLPTCQPQLWLVNTSNDSTRAIVTGPPDTIMAWSTFDTVDQALWVENYTYYGPTGSFLRYNLTTLALLGNVVGAPPRGSAIGYDAVDNLLIATDLNGSEQISLFDATNASLLASYSSPSGGVHPFNSLAIDPTSRLVVAAGAGNGSTLAFRLPTLALAHDYPSFPLSQSASAVDPTSGVAYIVGMSPANVRAVNETDGARGWETTLPGAASPSAVAVDPANGRVFVSDASDGTLVSLRSTDGTLLGSYPLGATTDPCALVLDPALGTLYVGETFPPAVVAFNLTRLVVSGTLALPGTFPCGLAVNPASGDLNVLSTATTGSVTDVRVPSLVVGPSWPVLSSPLDLAPQSTGSLDILDSAGSHLTILDGVTGASEGGTDLGGFRASGLAVDEADHLLFLSGSADGVLQIRDAANGSLAGALTTTGALSPPRFDTTSFTLEAPLASNGELFLASLVPVPSAPTDLRAEFGNGSANVSWSPPLVSGPYAVDSYEVAAIDPTTGSLVVERNPTALNVSITGLTNGVNYTVTAGARSFAGLGVELASTWGTPVGVPYPPTSVEVTSAGPGELRVAWSPPASDDGGAILGYTVHLTAASDGSTRSLDAGTGLNVTASGLGNGATYAVEVTAQNVAGTGHPSLSVTGTTGASPPGGFPVLWLEVGLPLAAAIVAGVWVVRHRRRARRPPNEPSNSSSRDGEPPSAES